MDRFWVVAIFYTLAVEGDAESSSYSSVHPGHLLPFGSPFAGPRLPVPEIPSFPSPATFLKEYVRPAQPVLMKGVFKDAPALSLWEDDYFR